MGEVVFLDENKSGMEFRTTPKDEGSSYDSKLEELLSLRLEQSINGKTLDDMFKALNDEHMITDEPYHNLISEGVEQVMANDENNRYDELKEDLRESERRLSSDIKEREQRFENTVKHFNEEAKNREDRFISDNKEREERFIRQLQQVSDEAKEREQRLITIMDNLDKKYDKNAERTETKLDQHEKHTESMKSQNFWGNIAMFAGMLAIVVTLLVFILQK